MEEGITKNRIIRESDIDDIIERKLAELTGESLNIKPKEKHHNTDSKPKHLKPKEPAKLIFDFEENIDTIIHIFGNESTAEAIVKVLEDSPSEIQVLAKLIIDLHVRVIDILGE